MSIKKTVRLMCVTAFTCLLSGSCLDSTGWNALTQMSSGIDWTRSQGIHASQDPNCFRIAEFSYLCD